jgi:hypothetical protein
MASNIIVPDVDTLSMVCAHLSLDELYTLANLSRGMRSMMNQFVIRTTPRNDDELRLISVYDVLHTKMMMSIASKFTFRIPYITGNIDSPAVLFAEMIEIITKNTNGGAIRWDIHRLYTIYNYIDVSLIRDVVELHLDMRFPPDKLITFVNLRHVTLYIDTFRDEVYNILSTISDRHKFPSLERLVVIADAVRMVPDVHTIETIKAMPFLRSIETVFLDLSTADVRDDFFLSLSGIPNLHIRLDLYTYDETVGVGFIKTDSCLFMDHQHLTIEGFNFTYTTIFVTNVRVINFICSHINGHNVSDEVIRIGADNKEQVKISVLDGFITTFSDDYIVFLRDIEPSMSETFNWMRGYQELLVAPDYSDEYTEEDMEENIDEYYTHAGIDINNPFYDPEDDEVV